MKLSQNKIMTSRYVWYLGPATGTSYTAPSPPPARQFFAAPRHRRLSLTDKHCSFLRQLISCIAYKTERTTTICIDQRKLIDNIGHEGLDGGVTCNYRRCGVRSHVLEPLAIKCKRPQVSLWPQSTLQLSDNWRVTAALRILQTISASAWRIRSLIPAANLEMLQCGIRFHHVRNLFQALLL